MNRTLVFAAVSGLTMSTALAQAPAPPSPAPASPPAAASSTPGSSQIVSAQSKDEWLASKLRGTAVIGSDDQKIGDITDIVFDKSGKVKAFVVGVGGVLGLGAKSVAIEMTQFKEMPATETSKEQMKLSMTKDQLTQAAEFKPLPAPATTTGDAPTGSRPAGSRPAESPPAAPPR